ncbi:hydrolase [Actibacterium mucosum KCTC 23349]|uniref:Hydrolase n=1 Tax=Actibacterium mucosum KCTC 23349 TaxID=1454373 RepID=A0A037ZFK9_9RHOB|nr:alpha/beta hydrolase [Actibacterium mucosum]KAJ55270.1 hydrolase [Actibacterium mucosum KCTC 23349]
MQPAPFYADVAEAPPGGAAFWITATDGVRLRIAMWTGGEKGQVLLIPGRTEYIEKYGQAAGELIARGFSVAVLDYRGQGLADRLADDPMKGHVGAFADYQLDITAALSAMTAFGLRGPLHLLCHSLGGCLGLRALHTQPGIASAAFSAPMWGILLPRLLAPIAPAIAAVLQTLGMGSRFVPGGSGVTYVVANGFDGNTLTKDRQMWDYMARQAKSHPDLTLGSPTVHWLRRALVECHDLMVLPAPATPCLTYLGTDEAIVEPKAIKTRMASWPSARLELIDGAEHELMMEIPTIRTRFYDDIAAHFLQNGTAPLNAAPTAD